MGKIKNKQIMTDKAAEREVNKTRLLARRAIFYTNTAYILADMANSEATEAESVLRRIGKAFSHEDKRLFRMAADNMKRAKASAEIAARPIYDISDSENAITDSDYLCECLEIIIDRTGESDESKEEMLKYLRAKPSVMMADEWLKPPLEDVLDSMENSLDPNQDYVK